MLASPMKWSDLIRVILTLAAIVLAILLSGASGAKAMSRIKDLAAVEGIRQNQLVGYGIVVGLNGTGDTLNNALSRANPLRRCSSGWASTRAAPTCAPPTWRP